MTVRRADFLTGALPADEWKWCEMCESEVLVDGVHTCFDIKAERARRAAEAAA